MKFTILCAASMLCQPAMSADNRFDSLPSEKSLPSPFVFLDGSQVKSVDDWNRRRAELKELFQSFEYGHFPPKPDTLSITSDQATNDDELHATKRLLEVTLQHGGKTLIFHIQLILPSRLGRYPVVIRPSFMHPPATHPTTAPLPRNDPPFYVSRGYALAEFNAAEIAPDKRDRTSGIYALFDDKIDTGVLMAWAWGFSRTIDALEHLGSIDVSHIVACGHSRFGKAALIAGAFDERIAMTQPSHSGAGGTAPYRFLYGKSEAIENITGVFEYWFAPGFKSFVGKVDRLPFDQHLLRALVAPRAQLSTEGTEDAWSNPQGSQLTFQAAMEVYEFLGAREKLSIRFRPVAHIPNAEDLLEFSDHLFFGKPISDAFGNLPYSEMRDAMPWTAHGQ